jgi:hypothetical protein
MEDTMTTPTIGTHGYYSIGSDAYPVTVIAVSKSGKKITVQYDKFYGDKENGHDYFGQQKWRYERNENGRIEDFRWSDRRKRFQGKGGTGSVYLNGWFAKQDPSF